MSSDDISICTNMQCDLLYVIKKTDIFVWLIFFFSVWKQAHESIGISHITKI